jgi:hypothetical protein
VIKNKSFLIKNPEGVYKVTYTKYENNKSITYVMYEIGTNVNLTIARLPLFGYNIKSVTKEK